VKLHSHKSDDSDLPVSTVRAMASDNPGVPRWDCFSRQSLLVPALQDVTPFELGKAATQIRSFLGSLQFDEILLSPLTSVPIDYLDHVIDVEGIGQLRFNTEPEIWQSAQYTHRFYSISSLFRRETDINPLRRSAFYVVDFYQLGVPESMLSIFRELLGALANAGIAPRLVELPFDNIQYDLSIDGPSFVKGGARWAIASGYDAKHSFYEINEEGVSTRHELFLVTPDGFLEVGVFGLTGWNKNPDYKIRPGSSVAEIPDLRMSGMGFGLERLLLAERILAAKQY
jgi:hypothetical protein